MSEPFSYAVLQLVPDLERGERLNVGVVVFCRPLDFLGALTALDESRVAALGGDVDLDGVRRHLGAIERIAAGNPSAGPLAALDTTARFHWLVAPSSTMIQPSAVHTSIGDDPDGQLDRLFEALVAPPPAG